MGAREKQGDQLDASAIVQRSDEGGLEQGRSHAGGQEWIHSRYSWKSQWHWLPGDLWDTRNSKMSRVISRFLA